MLATRALRQQGLQNRSKTIGFIGLGVSAQYGRADPAQ